MACPSRGVLRSSRQTVKVHPTSWKKSLQQHDLYLLNEAPNGRGASFWEILISQETLNIRNLLQCSNPLIFADWKYIEQIHLFPLWGFSNILSLISSCVLIFKYLERLQSFQDRESICSVLVTVLTRHWDTNRIGISDCFNKNYKIYQKWGTRNYLDTWNNWKSFTILEMLVCCIRLSLVTNTVVFDWK